MRRFSIIVLVVSAFAAPAWADISYSVAGSVYSQSFDTLATSGTTNAWADDTTIQGWFSTRTTYIASAGTSTTGALYSFGSTSSTERALGSIGSNSTGSVLYGARFTNDSGLTLSKFRVTYTGEQWRNGGNTTAHQLDFSYLIGAVPGLSSTGFVDVDPLDFVGPVATATAGALDGNDPANRVSGITFSVSGVSWNPGEQLLLRWSDANDAGSDHGLGIDDFSFSAVPEPSMWVMAGIIGLAGLVGHHFRVRRKAR